MHKHILERDYISMKVNELSIKMHNKDKINII